MKSVERVVSFVVIGLFIIVFVGVFANDANGQRFRRYSRPTYRTPTYRTMPQKTVPQEAKMVAFVRQMQSMTVRTSYNDHDCFTDIHLRYFRQPDGPCSQVAANLTQDSKFIELLEEVRALSNSTQQRIFAKAARTYKPTWRQIGRISPQGQTVAGQQAERMVASTVVSTAKKMLAKSQAQLAAEAKRMKKAESGRDLLR